MIGVGIERYTAVCRPHHFRRVQMDNYRSGDFIENVLNVYNLIQVTHIHSSWSICWIGREWIKVRLYKYATNQRNRAII